MNYYPSDCLDFDWHRFHTVVYFWLSLVGVGRFVGELLVKQVEVNQKLQEAHLKLDQETREKTLLLQSAFDATLLIEIPSGLIVESGCAANTLFQQSVCGRLLQDLLPNEDAGKLDLEQFLQRTAERSLHVHENGKVDLEVQSAQMPRWALSKHLATFQDEAGCQFDCELRLVLPRMLDGGRATVTLGIRLFGEKRKTIVPIYEDDEEEKTDVTQEFSACMNGPQEKGELNEALGDSLGEALLGFDGRLYSCSESWSGMLGRNVEGMLFQDILPRMDQDLVHLHLQRLHILPIDSVARIRVRFVRASDGNLFEVALTIQPPNNDASPGMQARILMHGPVTEYNSVGSALVACVKQGKVASRRTRSTTSSQKQDRRRKFQTPSSMAEALPLLVQNEDGHWCKFQVNNTFLEVRSHHSSEGCVGLSPWTDDRAGLQYGTYPSLVVGACGPPVSDLSISTDRSEYMSSQSSEIDSNCGTRQLLLASTVHASTSAEVISLAEFSRVPRHPVTGKLTSLGSASHFIGDVCKPCEWLQRGRACKNEWRCPFCHLVDEHPSYRQTRPRQRRKHAVHTN